MWITSTSNSNSNSNSKSSSSSSYLIVWIQTLCWSSFLDPGVSKLYNIQEYLEHPWTSYNLSYFDDVWARWSHPCVMFSLQERCQMCDMDLMRRWGEQPKSPEKERILSHLPKLINIFEHVVWIWALISCCSLGLENVYGQQSHLHKPAWTRKKKPLLSAFAEGVLKGIQARHRPCPSYDRHLHWSSILNSLKPCRWWYSNSNSKSFVDAWIWLVCGESLLNIAHERE